MFSYSWVSPLWDFADSTGSKSFGIGSVGPSPGFALHSKGYAPRPAAMHIASANIQAI